MISDVKTINIIVDATPHMTVWPGKGSGCLATLKPFNETF